MNSYRRVVFFGYRDYLGTVPVILRIGEVSNASDALGRLARPVCDLKRSVKPEPKLSSRCFLRASGCVNDASCNSRSILRCMQPIAFQTFAFLLWSRATGAAEH